MSAYTELYGETYGASGGVFRLRKPGGGSTLRGGDTLRGPDAPNVVKVVSETLNFIESSATAEGTFLVVSETLNWVESRNEKRAIVQVLNEVLRWVESAVHKLLYIYVTPLEAPSPMSATVRQATPTTADSDQNQLVRVNGTAGALSYGFLDFDIPPEVGAGATVIKAHVLLYKSAAWTSGNKTVTLTPITADWDPLTITYNTMPTVGTGAAYTVSGSGAAGDLIELDVTTQIRDAVATRDTGTNTFFGFRLSTTSTDDLTMYSSFSTVYWPDLRIEISRPPNPPEDLLPSSGRAVSKTKPPFVSRFTDLDAEDTISAINLRVSTVEDFATTVYASGDVVTNSATFDFAAPPAGAPAPPTLATGTTLYWDNAVRDNHGLWSERSATAQFQVVLKGTLTLTSPAGATVASPTPTITVTFTPAATETAREREIEIEKFEDGLWRTHLLLKRHVSSSLTYTVPDADALSEGVNYRVFWRLFDSVDRSDQAGDREFLEVSREFVLTTVST